MEEKTKILGGIGSILLILGIIPYIGLVFSLIGIILLLIAVKEISDRYKEEKIFKNFVIGVVVGIIGAILAGMIGVTTLIPFILSNNENVAGIGTAVAIAVGITLFYVATVISGLFYKKAFVSIGKVTNNELFNWAGKLIFWGSVATILLFLGTILIWIGWILSAVAFFTAEGSSPEEGEQAS